MSRDGVRCEVGQVLLADDGRQDARVSSVSGIVLRIVMHQPFRGQCGGIDGTRPES